MGINPQPLCKGHVASTGQPCKRRAVIGYSVCWSHGAAGAEASKAKSLKHGRDSVAAPKGTEIERAYKEYLADPKLLDASKIAARMLAYFDNARKLFDAKIEAGGNLSSEESEELRAWSDALSKLMERANKILYGERYTVTYEQLQVLTARIAHVITTEITDPELRARVIREIAAQVGGPGEG